MRSKWKRIQDFFTVEIEDADEEREDETEYNKQTEPLKTKMMYEYPDIKQFRFPIIPDETNKQAQSDLPAYKRRNNQQKTEDRRQKTVSSSESQRGKPVKEKLNKRPFQPTRVASPIHGYQERKRARDIKNIPAYVRKQQTEAYEKNNQSVPEEIVEINNDVEAPIEIQKNAQITKDSQAEIASSVIEDNKEQNKVKETKKPNKRVHTNPTRRTHKRINNKQKVNKNKTREIPYNVLMTPKDKKSLLKQKERITQTKPKQNRSNLNKQLTFPPYHLLNDPEEKSSSDQLWVKSQQQLLEKTLKHFKVDAKVVHATQGPSVTRFEVQPAMGVKVSRVRNLSDDIKLNMAAKDIRIEAPIPGKNTIGIEVPNLNSQMVGLQEIFTADEFQQSTSPLTIGLGLTIEGHPLITNISKMPHGLIAGATGSGKSVCINTILISLLYKSSHEDVKFLLIDPKMVELAPYNGIPHLVAPVITDVKAATASLKWAVGEMEDRYGKFVKEGVRDIERYNDKILKQDRQEEKMPFIVIVIDELADLMMMAPQDVEDSICRIAQKARACGIHLLVATQRPSVDVITGLIKANIPTRIAFSVSSQVDSRTIIDANGAEKLLGKGDMLFVENGSRNSLRLQGAFVSDEEIERVTNYARSMAPPNYLFEQDELIKLVATEEEEDDLLEDVIQFIFEQNSASTSLLQRNFRIGYNRAARLIDVLENRGLISGQNGSKPRDVLLSELQYEEEVLQKTEG